MLLIAIAVLLLVVAGYAQWQTENFVLDRARAMGIRMLLVLLGIAVGIVFARTTLGSDAEPAAVFFIGFGLVHLPAAAILFLKRQRGEGRT
jgi:hypothetical protein